MTGVFDSSNDLGGEVEVGDVLRGSYSFESTSPPQVPGSGSYPNAIIDFSANIDSVQFQGPAGPIRSIDVINDFFLGGFDHYTVQVDVIRGTQPLLFGMGLRDPSGSFFASDVLPTEPPSLELMDEEASGFTIGGSAEALRIEGRITSITAIPDPSTFLLLGMSGLFLLARKQVARHGDMI